VESTDTMLKQTAPGKHRKMYLVNKRRGDACSTCGGNYKCTKILITKTAKQQATENIALEWGLGSDGFEYLKD
jgi:TPP-dependent indolepyruvate ferredoxin oxidoreductase alpha subunit